MQFELSIVIPCLNEQESIGLCITKAKKFLNENLIIGEVIVGDNGSIDQSISIASSLGARVINITKKGYGAACQGATQAALGKYIIMGDGDNTYDFSDLHPFLEQLRAGADLVMGNRFLGKIQEGAMPWKNRYLGNPILTGIGKIFFKTPIGDFHCGLRGFSKKAYQQLQLTSPGMEYASEMVIKAVMAKMKIVEVPTNLYLAHHSREPHLRPYRDGWRHLKLMLFYKPRWLFFYPGLLLLFIGSIWGMIIWKGPLVLDKISFDTNTLIYCGVFISIGLQLVSFSIITKIHGHNIGLVGDSPYFKFFDSDSFLDKAIIIGASIFLFGFILACISVYMWWINNFGALDRETILRLVVPSALFLTIGTQIIFSSFMISIVGSTKSLHD